MTPIALSAAGWIFIGLPLLVIWGITIADIVRHGYPRATMFGWILIVVLLPVAGTIAYLLLRKPSAKEIEQAHQAERHPPEWPLTPRVPGD